MKKFINKSVLFIMAAVLCLSLLPPTEANAATSNAAAFPEYLKQGYLVAHALGALSETQTCTNSFEAFIRNYELGHRVFEVDLQLTADDRLVTMHSQFNVGAWTYDQLRNSQGFTIMDFETLCLLMLEFDDVYMITDTKYLDIASNRRAFDIISQTINRVDPALFDRFVIQFYNQEMFHFLVENYDFPHENLIYTLYMSHDSDREVVRFVAEHGIRAVVMWYHRASRNFVTSLKEVGALVYAHTVNDVAQINELFSVGVYGIFTCFVTYADLNYSRTGRFSLMFHNLSPWAEPQVGRAIADGIVPSTLQHSYNKAMTRAEFAALAVALYETIAGEEITGRMNFYDTNDINIQKAAYIGIVSGTGYGNFSPDMGFNREQAAVFVSRLAGAIGQPLPQVKAAFADNAQISLWAIESAGQVQAAGIMSGVGYNAFDPHGAFTREQSIITVYRLFQLLS